MSLTETAALGGLLFGFAGLILSVMNYMRSRSNSEAMIADTQKARRANASSEFLKEYYGPEFMVVRSEAWNVGFEFCEKNKKASKQVALYLIGDKDFDPRSNNVPIAELGPNNQTPLQNLSRVVNFWHRIAVYTRLKLVDREILTPLRYEYELWSPFFSEITDLANDHAASTGKAKQQVPDWLPSLKQIGKYVW